MWAVLLCKVVVDLKTAITLKPEARTKWLSKAGSSVPLNNYMYLYRVI